MNGIGGLAGSADDRETHRRLLVRRAEMRPASRAKTRGGGFQHKALREPKRGAGGELRRGHHAGIEVRQKPVRSKTKAAIAAR